MRKNKKNLLDEVMTCITKTSCLASTPWTKNMKMVNDEEKEQEEKNRAWIQFG